MAHVVPPGVVTSAGRKAARDDVPGGVREVVGGVVLGRAVTVRVPASSANLGPGFDSLGLAFGVHDLVTVEAVRAEGAPSAEVVVEGEGARSVPLDESHLVVRSVRSGLARSGAAQPGLRLRCRNAIPHGRGLGSSSAAIVAGLLGARGLLADPGLLDDATVFELATDAEGHPDNAAATLFGGFTIAWTEGAGDVEGAGGVGARGTARAVRVPLDERVRAVLCVPDGELATSRARAMLPAHVPHADAAFTAGRAALLVEALSRRPELLFSATVDRLHQDLRAPAMPGTARLLHAVRAAGGAAVVSGAGPSLLVLGTGDGPSSIVRAVLDAGGPPGGEGH
ncbi:MAG: homoserine kinase, partial [Actinomycetota bacterium]|nr:homoserine kinase [Actinomycetota bacterium]